MLTHDEVHRKASVALILRAVSTADVDLGDQPGNRLKRYWLHDPRGLRKWWFRKSGRFTALRRHLLKYMGPERATRTAAEWFHEKAGYWPGSDLNRVHAGKRPRGQRVGPG
jgi:hypothetical protein